MRYKDFKVRDGDVLVKDNAYYYIVDADEQRQESYYQIFKTLYLHLPFSTGFVSIGKHHFSVDSILLSSPNER